MAFLPAVHIRVVVLWIIFYSCTLNAHIRHPLDSCCEDLSIFIVNNGMNSGFMKLCSNKRKINSFPHNPWFDDEYKEAKARRRIVFKSWRKDIQNENLRSNYFKINKKYRNLICKKKRLNESLEAFRLMLLKNYNPRDFWKCIRKPKENKAASVPMSDWFIHFKNLHSPVVSGANQKFFSKNEPNHGIDYLFTIEEVEAAIRSMKGGTSPVIYGISIDVIKCLNTPTVRDLVEVFNRILKSSEFPSYCSTGLIVPIHKSGDTSSPDNYRGIYLLCSFSKIFTTAIGRRLELWCESENILSKNQFGFRQGHRTTDAIFIFSTLIEKSKATHKPLVFCFIDLKKAFDNVNHEILWKKLLQLGLNGEIMAVIENMYHKAIACVISNGSHSDLFDCNIGVRQGCPLSPLLFSFFINDVLSVVESKVTGFRWSAQRSMVFCLLMIWCYVPIMR